MASRLEFKVGAFVLAGMALLAVLMLQFSKGSSVFRSSYTIYLESQDVGGLRERAAVLMSGVQIGSVSAITLKDNGRSVLVSLRIDGRQVIYTNATFTLEQAGFLGDQYVAVQQREPGSVAFKEGGHAVAEKPFNIQEAARSAQVLINRVDEMALGLSDAIADMRRLVLNEATLTNVTSTVNNLRLISERALATLGGIEQLIGTNSPAVYHSTSNLAVFSDELARAGASLNELVNTNGADVTQAIQNIEQSTETLKAMLQDVQSGKGLAGALVKDERIANDIAKLTYNLSITSSNLNRLGLWGILWKKKRAEAEDVRGPELEERVRSPKAANR